MSIVLGILYLAIHLLVLIVLARFVLEMVTSWARNWRPRGAVLVLASVVYGVTDPVFKPLRRLIPPLQMGGIALDLSALILIFGLSLLQSLVRVAFYA
ncbi:YggT family protein [Kocuria sp. JC486]|uniref:YggT family protein n=1 Tax=Kocuria soli TaxID=2485125 RepID=A0A3N3ZRN7_9MICC|nr:YggT family protein [Kocuria soli]NHU84403.1 YggT family protein [Kocuria sp. JC486]ROZ63987.1 YggT family protein [Kocuria soli]